MMLNYFWISFILLAFVGGVYSYFIEGNIFVFQNMANGIFEYANDSVMKVALPLVGIMAFWLGMMKIAEEAGLIQRFSKLLFPFFSNLFPSLPKNHPAVGHMTMNFSANLLGLDNAATPFGLKAMQSLQDINSNKDVASNPQIMFVLLHASGLTIIPISVMAQRAIYGASNPSDVFIPIAISTAFTTLVSLGITSLWQGIRLRWRFVFQLLGFILGLTIFVAWVYMSSISGQQKAEQIVANLPAFSEISHWSQADWERYIPHIKQLNLSGSFPLDSLEIAHTMKAFVSQKKNQSSLLLGNIVLLLIPIFLIVYGLFKKQNVFAHFLEGAKESFSISIKIIPYLVGLLVAIGLMRSSGIIDMAVGWISHLMGSIGIRTDAVPSLSVALMKPLSGSGARAMMIENMNTYGVDSFVGRLSSIFQGTSDTLLYVIALYFGSVGVKHTRYAVAIGLLIDAIGIAGAIAVGYFFFHLNF